MKVIGIDPGTSSWDIFGYETTTNEVFMDKSIPAISILESPDVLLTEIAKCEPFDALVAPSGFGIPLKKVHDLNSNDYFEITLRKESSNPTMGLQKILQKSELSPSRKVTTDIVTFARMTTRNQNPVGSML